MPKFKIIRPNELAGILSVSRTTLWRWSRDGRLPPQHAVGPNVTGWLEHEIEEWWAAKTEGRVREDTTTPEEPAKPETPKLRVVTVEQGS